MERGEDVDLSANVEKMAAQLDSVVQNAEGEMRIGLEAVQAMNAQIIEASRRYDEVVAGLSIETFFDLPPLATREAIAGRRQNVEAFRAENQRLRAVCEDAENTLRRELQQRGISKKNVTDAVAGFRRNWTPRVTLMFKIRDCDAALAADMLEFLDLADANRGRWHFDGAAGIHAFDDPDAMAEFQDLMLHVADVGHQQEEYQKELLRSSQPPARN